MAAVYLRMRFNLLLCGHCFGVFSIRNLERAAYENAAFLFLSGNLQSDHHTIATIRRCHLQALGGLFVKFSDFARKADW